MLFFLLLLSFLPLSLTCLHHKINLPPDLLKISYLLLLESFLNLFVLTHLPDFFQTVVLNSKSLEEGDSVSFHPQHFIVACCDFWLIDDCSVLENVSVVVLSSFKRILILKSLHCIKRNVLFLWIDLL